MISRAKDLPPEESAVIACVLSSDGMFMEVQPILKHGDFSSVECAAIYETFESLSSKNSRIDAVTVSHELKVIGYPSDIADKELLQEISDSYSGSGDIVAYANIVKNRSLRTKLKRLGSRILEIDESDDPKLMCDEAYASIVDIAGESVSSNEPVSISSVFSGNFQEMQMLKENNYTRRGVQSGIEKLDTIMNVVEPQELFIIAARPSQGKTCLGTNIAVNVAKNHGPVLFSSLEMASRQIGQRILASEARVPLTRIVSGYLSSTDERNLEEASKQIQNMPLFIDDASGQTLIDIRVRARQLQIKHGLEMILVDYLQLVRCGVRGIGEYEEVTAVSKGLKEIAKDLNVPVFALAQLRRPPSGEHNRPTLSDLRSSGQIEQDADGVLFIHTTGNLQEDKRIREVELNIAKRRQGETGICENVLFDRPIQRFM